MKKLFSMLSALVLCASLCACGKEEPENKEIVIPILGVTEENYNTATAEVGSITNSYVTDAEYTYPYSRIVYVKKGGEVKKIHFDPSEPLKAGQLMIEFDTTQFDEALEAQQLKVDEAQKNYDDLKKQGASKAKLDVAQIDLDIEKNALDKINNQIDDYKVYSPIDGVIQLDRDARNLEMGSVIDDGRFIGRITDRTNKYLTATVFGVKLENVDFGTKVEIAQGDVAFGTGSVQDIIFTERGEFSTYQYIIAVDGDTEFYDFGTVRVTFCVYEKENVVIVPKEAIVNVGSRTFVYTIVDGIRIETDVEVGITDDLNGVVEITSGLDGGETVVI